MINTNLKFMKSKEITPHEFYFIDEALFQNQSTKLINKERGGGINLSTIGNIEFDNNLWYLTFGSAKVPLNISRIIDLNPSTKKELYPPYYMIYGEIKLEGGQPVIVVQFARNIGNKLDVEAYRKVVIKKRELIFEAINQDFIY